MRIHKNEKDLKMKKLISVIVAIAAVCFLSVPAMATDPVGSLEVNGMSGIEAYTFTGNPSSGNTSFTYNGVGINSFANGLVKGSSTNCCNCSGVSFTGDFRSSSNGYIGAARGDMSIYRNNCGIQYITGLNGAGVVGSYTTSSVVNINN